MWREVERRGEIRGRGADREMEDVGSMKRARGIWRRS